LNLNFKPQKQYSVLILVLFLTLLTGCLGSKGKYSDSADEEAYIDLKHGFSLVIPVTWRREQLPVSSSKYKADTVVWDIKGMSGRDTRLSIKTYEQSKSPITPEDLTALIQSRPDATAGVPFNFKHPAGQAIRVEETTPTGKLIMLAISTSLQAFLLSIEIPEADYDRLLPKIEKTILSFTILTD